MPASALSGGNLQKLLIGRELAHEAPLLLVEQPTRGVDIGAIQNIHDQLIAYRDAGHAVLLVSAELSEIRGLADRVLVMYEGRITATYRKDEADERTLGLAMAGGTVHDGGRTTDLKNRISGALRSPVTFSVLAGVLIGALFLVGTGADPVTAYEAVLTGSLGADGIGSTLSTGTSVLGLALALAIPLRAGLINLGGDGQMVLGGITAAVTGLYSPLPAPLTVVLALLAGMAAGAAYAALAALCENHLGVPLLVSSLLLSYPAVSLASYLARYPLKEPGSSLPQTRAMPDGVALPAFGDSTVTVGLVLVGARGGRLLVHRPAHRHRVRDPHDGPQRRASPPTPASNAGA